MIQHNHVLQIVVLDLCTFLSEFQGHKYDYMVSMESNYHRLQPALPGRQISVPILLLVGYCCSSLPRPSQPAYNLPEPRPRSTFYRLQIAGSIVGTRSVTAI